jgi:type IV secretory pathway VirB2 component (pilin)
MESWMPFFVVVTAIAVVFQACMLAALFISVRSLSKRIEETTSEIRSRVAPILGRVQMIVDDVHPQISSMVADAAHITRVARTQVQNADRVVGEAIDRLRLQLAHTDQILTGALETVEEAGATIRRTVLGPVQSVTAIVRGIQTGLEFFRGNRTRRRDDAPATAEAQDETLFI